MASNIEPNMDNSARSNGQNMIASSPPVPIPTSAPIAINSGHGSDIPRNHSPWSDTSDEEGGIGGASALSEALRNSDTLGELQVGSLPMHLRRPHAQHHRGGGGGLHRQANNYISGGFAGPMSLPPPRAPFLTSRGDGMEEKLSKIPEVILPESVASAHPQSMPVQYGSLRESNFARFHDRRRGGQMQGAANDALPSQTSGVGNRVGASSGLPSSNSANANGGLIGLLMEQDGVDGITDSCAEITLNEGVKGGDGRSTNFDDSAPLSRSLTALDILTRMREQPQTPGNNAAGIEPLEGFSLTPSGDNNAQQGQTQTQTQRHSSFADRRNSDGGASRGDDDDPCFDLEM